MNNLPVCQYRLLESRIYRGTRFGIVVIGVLIVALSVAAFYHRSVSGKLESEVAALRPSLERAQRTLAEADRESDVPTRTSYEALKEFQKRLEQVAVYRGCFITTFQVAGEPGPYVDLIDKSPSGPSLTQGSLRFELNGKTLDVITAIQQIAACEVPLEFDSLEFRRGKANVDGANLIATGSLRIIGEIPGGKTS